MLARPSQDNQFSGGRVPNARCSEESDLFVANSVMVGQEILRKSRGLLAPGCPIGWLDVAAWLTSGGETVSTG
jgi:hypothetical protein